MGIREDIDHWVKAAEKSLDDERDADMHEQMRAAMKLLLYHWERGDLTPDDELDKPTVDEGE